MPFPQSIDTQELPLSVAILFTAPKQLRLTDVILSNNTGSQIAVTIYIVPQGGTPVSSNKVFGTVTVDANDTHFIQCNVVFNQGATIRAFASATGLNITGTITDEKPPH